MPPSRPKTDAPPSPAPATVPSRAAAALDRLRQQLTLRLAKPDALAAFEEAKIRHTEALSPYATPTAAIEHVLALTGGCSEHEVTVTNAVLRAIVLEYQATTRDVWSAALVLATGPAMGRLAFLARSRRLDPDDLIHQMVESLLVMARAYSAADDDTYLPVYLKREMTRHAFLAWTHTRKDHRRTHAAVNDALERGRIEPFVGGRDEVTSDPLNDMIAREAWKFAVHTLGPVTVGELLLTSPSLRNLTRIARPDLSKEEQERLYQRIKRGHARSRAKGLDLNEPTPAWRELGREAQDWRKTS